MVKGSLGFLIISSKKHLLLVLNMANRSHLMSNSRNERENFLIWCFFVVKPAKLFNVHCFLGFFGGLSKRRGEKVESAKKDAILLHHNDCSKVYLEPKGSLTQKDLWDSKWIAQWQLQSLLFSVIFVSWDNDPKCLTKCSCHDPWSLTWFSLENGRFWKLSFQAPSVKLWGVILLVYPIFALAGCANCSNTPTLPKHRNRFGSAGRGRSPRTSKCQWRFETTKAKRGQYECFKCETVFLP